MSKGKFAVGALLGAVVGFVAGVINAPKRGDETVADIKAVAGDIKTNVSEKVNMAAMEAGAAVDDVKAKAHEVSEDVKEKVQDVSEDVIAKATELKDRTERAIEGAKEGFSSDIKK